MFDSLNSKLYIRNKANYTAQFLTNVKPYRKGGLIGKLDNYSVLANDYFISLIGSISEFWNSDNTYCIGAKETKKAIEKLSDYLHLPIHKAKVTRLDISNSFEVLNDPKMYFPLFGKKGKQYPQDVKNGINYGTKYGNYLTTFYKKNAILFRYELKVKKPASALKIQKPRLEQLTEPTIYNLLLHRWKQHYYRIQKIKEMATNFEISGTKDIDKLRAAMVKEVAPEIDAIILAALAQKKAAGKIKCDRQYRRCIEYLNEKETKFSINNPLIKELNQKVNEVYESYLI